jgi:hypothetical protein
MLDHAAATASRHVLCRSRSGRPIGYDLNAAFAERVIGGPDAFVITVERAATVSTSEAS